MSAALTALHALVRVGVRIVAHSGDLFLTGSYTEETVEMVRNQKAGLVDFLTSRPWGPWHPAWDPACGHGTLDCPTSQEFPQGRPSHRDRDGVPRKIREAVGRVFVRLQLDDVLAHRTNSVIDAELRVDDLACQLMAGRGGWVAFEAAVRKWELALREVTPVTSPTSQASR